MVLCVFININIFHGIQIALNTLLSSYTSFFQKKKCQSSKEIGQFLDQFGQISLSRLDSDFGEFTDPIAAYQYPG